MKGEKRVLIDNLNEMIMLSREELIEELALHIVEVRKLREENKDLREKFERYSKEEERINFENEELEKKLSMEINDLPLNCSLIHKLLTKTKCRTVRDLVVRDMRDLLKYKNFGRASVYRVERVLDSMGLNFGMVL